VYIGELMARLTAITEGTVLLHDDSSSEYNKRTGKLSRRGKSWAGLARRHGMAVLACEDWIPDAINVSDWL
jgi:hypothetical protein